MSILKNFGKVNVLTITTKPSNDKKTRAKITTLDINSKKIKFPRKSIHTAIGNTNEISLIKREIDIPSVNEISLQITPKRLREIVANPNEHQKIKEDLKNVLSESYHKGINIGYPFLLNQRSPNEKEEDFKPFGKPTTRVIEKLFDLFDIDGIDVLILPSPSPNGYSLEWCKMSTDVFTKRKPDFMNEKAIFSGLIPLGNPSNHIKEMIDYYLKNKIESLTFDFYRMKVLESRMREIIEKNVGNKKWGNMYIHATNVPPNNYQGKSREPVLGSYDVLVSVYGFDSFGGIVIGGGSSKVLNKNEIKPAIQRKRYRLIETYGDYNYHGLKTLMQNEIIKCDSPIWKVKNILDIYDEKTLSNKSVDDLRNELHDHRNYVTHKEVNTYSNLIEKNTFLPHIQEKKAVTKELNSILNEFQKEKLNKFY